jgi:DNA helicase-2/ATP-dependent DNA helicase PcrA
LKVGKAQARKKECFDFTDQIWLPVQWKLPSQKWFKPYKFVLVDECQDLNASQLELAIALAGESGRLLFVGDPRQAIMGFAGADNNSYHNIVERTKATELPLSTCYRCPTSHINLVKGNFPEIPIEAAKGAPKGTITQCEESDLTSLLKTGDLVISRKTAPLVSLCIRLIARGIGARIKGRDIGESLKKDLEEIASIRGFQYSKFNEVVAQYKTEKIARFQNLDNCEELTTKLNDKIDALQVIYQNQPNATSIEDLGIYIDSLFSDDRGAVTLSTCHKAKGLEGDRIFIHKAADMPMTWRDQRDWQLEQEENLLYVALTRSKSELFVVGKPEWLVLGEKERCRKCLM